jgi:hypothetical protein
MLSVLEMVTGVSHALRQKNGGSLRRGQAGYAEEEDPDSGCCCARIQNRVLHAVTKVIALGVCSHWSREKSARELIFLRGS